MSQTLQNDNSKNSSELLAALIAEAVYECLGSVGVLIRDIPLPSPDHVLSALKGMINEGVDLRIAYLLGEGRIAADRLGLASSVFSDEVEQAERWRNDPALTGLIVVVAHGDEAKLSSLEDFSAVTSRTLKRMLVRRALGGEAGQNDVQQRWWRLLGVEERVGFSQLLDYYTALSGLSGAKFLAAASREVWRLGLLPDPELFDRPSEQTIRQRFEENKEIQRRLQILTPQDRKAIAKIIGSESDSAKRRELRETLDRLDRGRWEEGVMPTVSLGAAQQLLRTRTKRPPGPGKPTSERVSRFASQAMVDEIGRAAFGEMVQAFREELNKLDESRLRPITVAVAVPDEVDTEATSVVRLDVLNLFSKVLRDGSYGGLFSLEATDLESVLVRLDTQRHLVTLWERDSIAGFLDEASDDPRIKELSRQFHLYDSKRNAVLAYARMLAVEPLAVAADINSRGVLKDFVEAYEELNRLVREGYDCLFNMFGHDVNEVLGRLLLMETVVVKTETATYAVLSPTHPLFIWHYATYCEIVDLQKDQLDDRDRALVVEAASRLPNFLSSLFVPASALGTAMDLPFAGRIGPLPYFTDKVQTNSAEDGVLPLRTLVEAHLAFEPHTRAGLRLAVVDPPSSGVFLSTLADLAEAGLLEGAHLAVYRHPRLDGHAVELQLEEGEEERIARVFRALTPQRQFTFDVRPLAQDELGPPEEDRFHIIVVFDQSNGLTYKARPASHPIQPLAIPRRIHYSQLHKTVELEPAPGGPFDAYSQLVGRLYQGGGTSYLTVHQNQTVRDALTRVAMRAPWIAVVDRQVDRDLHLGSLRIMTARDGTRDLAAFARATSPFRRPLRDVVRQYNAFISSEELDDLLVQLSDLLDEGLLSLRPDATGHRNDNYVKGLLGTLIAARWFRTTGTQDNRLLLSLDGAEARRWLHLAANKERADLVGLEWTNDHCTVRAIEVKTVQNTAAEYTVSGNIVSGPAVQQLLSTRQLLMSVFGADRTNELITTPARREIMREHMYRELTKGSYTPAQRKIWADRLQRLLDGLVPADIRCHLIDVRLGVDTSSLENRVVVAEYEGNSVAVDITQLNEREMSSLSPQPAAAPPGDAQRGMQEVPDPRTETPDWGDATQETKQPERQQERTPVLNSEHPRALLGTAPGVYGHPREVWFEPDSPDNRLPNPHIAISGETGSGKTQATKALMSDLTKFGVPALVLDFKDDYSDPGYATSEALRVYDPNYEPLPFNPLAPALDPRTGHVNLTHHLHQLTEIVKRIYRLGDQQAFRLREALKAVYEQLGLPMGPFQPELDQVYPPFSHVRRELEGSKENLSLLGRMSPIFDLGLFAAEGGESQFKKVVETSTVVRLAQLPGDETKNSVAEFFLMALYNYLIRVPQSHGLRRLLVLDEAWRLVQSPFLEPLMREGRAFGLGVIISTQFPHDLPAPVSGSTATKIFFSQNTVEQIRDIQRAIVGKTSGAEAEHLAGVLRGLGPLTCVIHSRQFTPFLRVSVKPFYERQAL